MREGSIRGVTQPPAGGYIEYQQTLKDGLVKDLISRHWLTCGVHVQNRN